MAIINALHFCMKLQRDQELCGNWNFADENLSKISDKLSCKNDFNWRGEMFLRLI